MPVLQKLSEAREKFHSKKLEKTGHNKFAGYYYFELGDFLVPALGIFKECGIIGVISFTKEEAKMTITDLEDNSETVITSPMSSAALKGCHEVQNLGAVQTYMRRYLWVAALEIVEHDAIDSSEPLKSEKKAHPATPTGGLWEAQSEESRTFLSDIAMETVALLVANDAPGAVAFVKSKNLDADEQAALWTRFDSKQRAAMKAVPKE